MNRTGRIIVCVICGLLILSAPFLISSPSLLSEVKWEIMEEMNAEEEEGGEEGNLIGLLIPAALAEEAEEKPSAEDLIVETLEEGDSEMGPAVYSLPLDFSLPPAARKENFTEDSYEDETIRARLETREENGVIWHIAYVQIASPTQIRTATARSAELDETYRTGTEKELEKALKKVLTSTKEGSIPGMAKSNRAVVAINGDNFAKETTGKTFIYRQTQKIHRKKNSQKDLLIIDENGDFHMILACPEKELWAAVEALEAEHQIINAFTFGPALVMDGQELVTNKNYKFNPNGKEPRAAIGQMGKLSYVAVVAEGRGESVGVTHQELAHFMAELGCLQAYNLDGGNAAELVFGEQNIKGQPGGEHRGANDIIYFATALPEE